MAIHKLTPRKVATAHPGKFEDGGGLRLVVSNSLAKKWVLRFTIDGKRREMGLGSFPDVGLAEARGKATDHRKNRQRRVLIASTRGKPSPRKYPPSPPVQPGISVRTGAAGIMPSTPGNG